MTEDLFQPPAHEALIESRTRDIETWLRDQFAKLRYDVDQRLRHVVSFHNRSIAQRRRFWRLRILQEKTS